MTAPNAGRTIFTMIHRPLHAVRWLSTIGGCLLAAMLASSRCSAQIDCAHDTVANDTTFAEDAAGPFLGSAIGQVFVAPDYDSLLTSIVVWRATNDFATVGMHLFLFGVNPLSGEPDTHDMILDGPTVTVQSAPAPGALIRVPFEFDPPVVLPRAGVRVQYAMAFQAANCYIGEPWRILANVHDSYGGGWFFESNRSTGLGCPIYSPVRTYNADLIFEATFCHDAVTPVRHTSWGELKILYR